MKARVEIVMLRTEMGQDTGEDGVALSPKRYRKGEKHTVSESLAKCFFDLGAAELAEKPEKKMKDGAPSNKALGAAPKNK